MSHPDKHATGTPVGQKVRVNRRELARLLRVFRERRGETQSGTETRLKGLLLQTDARGGNASPLAQVNPIAALEDRHAGDASQLELSVNDLEVLAGAYGIPRLMLDSLLAEQTD